LCFPINIQQTTNMIFAFVIVTILYLILIGLFIYGFEKVKSFRLNNLPPIIRLSIVIPFKNEEKNIPALVESIIELNYPRELFEIIFVDDHSDDNAVNLIHSCFAKEQSKGIDFLVINSVSTSKSPKKDAITTAIHLAQYEWIITTDADCILPKYWLDSFDEFIQLNDVVSIAAPVAYLETNSFLGRFQVLDFLSLQAATIGAFGIKKPFLCNGANFAYKKDIFNQLNGFVGNTDIASGDDIFLLEKINKLYPKRIKFLKCDHAIVKTKPQDSFVNLVSQRIRWAAKTSAYKNVFGKLTGILVLLMNALIIIGLLGIITNTLKISIFLYVVFIKFNIDVLLISKAAAFYNQKRALTSIIFSFICYPFFTVYVAVLSMFKGYTWKNRSYKK
jgi:biofilm PGA synthesis N-glycosyltransferase PgaC